MQIAMQPMWKKIRKFVKDLWPSSANPAIQTTNDVISITCIEISKTKQKKEMKIKSQSQGVGGDVKVSLQQKKCIIRIIKTK